MPTISAAAHDVQYSGPVDEVSMALSWHDGDVRKTVRTLLDDCKHLREQLALAEVSMSIGYSRGWAPSYDRD
jgi:hypothetical protein